MDTNVFRIKKFRDSNKSNKESGGTLDSIHQNIVSDIKNILSPESLKEKEKEILETLETIDEKEIYKMTKLQEELKTIQKKLHEEDPLESYYIKNADIMMKYYGKTDKKNTASVCVDETNPFIKYMSQDSGVPNKKELLDEYVTRMKIGTVDPDTCKNDNIEHCNRCNIAREELLEEGKLICPKCGSEEYMLVVSDYPSFRDAPRERNNYAYKKINHLNEILNQFQAKESTIIPDEVMNEIIYEIKKRRIRNVACLNEKDIREILKNLNRSKYYEHTAHIISRLNGNPPPTITPEIEDKIRTMFQEIQAPFILFCPNDRTNFLSYSFILYKFFELLDLDDYKVYFPLLKSRDRLIAHDIIWKKICDYLKWEFIQSV